MPIRPSIRTRLHHDRNADSLAISKKAKTTVDLSDLDLAISLGWGDVPQGKLPGRLEDAEESGDTAAWMVTMLVKYAKAANT